jgi:flavin reductase (DIM6/NTAB) family NADH-FMN oxidoreductase RutF
MNIADISNPRQVILVSSRAEIKSKFSKGIEVKDNIFTLSWHMPVSFEPMLYAISAGKQRFSTSLIKKSKVFCVNFMPIELKKEVMFCGRNSGENIDKFKESGLEKEECENIDCPRIKQALAFLECEVIQEIEAGDHIIFIGKVLNSRINKEGGRIYQVKGDKFATL